MRRLVGGSSGSELTVYGGGLIASSASAGARLGVPARARGGRQRVAPTQRTRNRLGVTAKLRTRETVRLPCRANLCLATSRGGKADPHVPRARAVLRAVVPCVRRTASVRTVARLSRRSRRPVRRRPASNRRPSRRPVRQARLAHRPPPEGRARTPRVA